MLRLDCEITIGKYVFFNVNSVSIELSRKSQVGRANIILPRRYNKNNIQQAIFEGDQVNIKLGYNGRLNDEFTGYVSSIGCNIPVEIECEDTMYKLKRTAVKPISWKSIKLEDVIKHVTPEAVIEVNDITLAPYYIKGQITAAKVLENLKDQFGLDVYYRPDGRLYVGIAYNESEAVKSKPVIYRSGLNIIDQDLKYQRAEGVRIKLRMISLLKSGKQLTYEAGDPDGEVRTIHEYNLLMDEMKALVDERLKLFKYDGLQGTFEAFGEPYATHSMIANIKDDKNPDYDGSYLIDTVRTKFGVGTGYRRDITLGKKAS